jgi:MerR family mercuric resistance operon transcriptional regulator
MASGDLTIGELADKVGVRIDTIRYYEKIGLLAAPERSAGNHRIYSSVHLEQLSFIVCAREYEFPLKDIEVLVGSFRGKAPTCSEVKALTDAHLERVRKKIAKLRTLERSLTMLTRQCRDDASTDCIIVQTLGAPLPEGRA